MTRVLLLAAVALPALLAVAMAACAGDGNGDGTGVGIEPTEVAGGTPDADGGATVDVNLTEYIVAPDPDSVPAGSITFNAENIGGEPHELIVIRSDLAPDSLPTNEDGTYDDGAEGTQVIGEIEAFPSGEARSGTFELQAGSYVLICNVVNENSGAAHYERGMYAPFEVTEGESP